MRALVLALFGCARAAAPAVEASPLDGCIPETRDGATTYSCGAAFLAMDAEVKGANTDDAIAENLNAFVEPFGKDVLARDDAPLVIEGSAHRAVRARVDLPEKGKFVAMMVVIRKASGVRVISCSAKDIEAPRCDRVLQHLGARAMRAL